tara:strand:+ start:50456 stop:53545 length:3090 start_codon:yes stop_codon:yes gene_type:complete
MKKQTTSEIFGTLLPYPVINSITLESGGSPNVSKNPHILNDNPTETATGISGLKSTVSFSMRDVAGPKGINAFFDKDELLSLIKFIVVKCTDASKTTNFIKNPNSLFKTVSELGYNKDTTGLSWSTLSALQLSNQDTSAPVQNINGDNIIERSAVVEIVGANNRPQHLSFFCITSLDKEALISGYDLTTAEVSSMFNELESLGGFSDLFESSHIIAIDGGSPSFTEVQYLLPNGNRWTGPVHQDAGLYVAGSTHDPSFPQPTLNKVNVTSNKVNDFRDFTGTSYLNENLYEPHLSTVARNNPLLTKTAKTPLLNSWITYGAPSTSSKGNPNIIETTPAHIFFVLDRLLLTQQYGYLGVYPIQIKEIWLVRTNSAGDVTRVLANSSMPLQNTDTSYEFYYVEDAAKEEDYSYKLEIKLDQAAQTKFMNDSIDTLRELVNALSAYYDAASGTYTTNISSADSKLGVEERKQLSYYDVYAQKYTPIFIALVTSVAWKSPFNINSLRKSTELFFSLFAKNVNLLGPAISSALDPETGSPGAILAVKEIYQSILGRIEKIYGNKRLKQKYTQDHAQKTVTKLKGPDLITIDLKEKLLLSKGADYGYNYLNLRLGDNGPTKLIYQTKDAFDSFMNKKANKYFSNLNGSSKLLLTEYGNIGTLQDSLYSFLETLEIHTGRTKGQRNIEFTGLEKVSWNYIAYSGRNATPKEERENILTRIFNHRDEKLAGTNNPNIFSMLLSKGISIDFKSPIPSPGMFLITDPRGLTNEDNYDDQYQINIDSLNELNLSDKYATIFSELKKVDDNKLSEYEKESYYDLRIFKPVPVQEDTSTFDIIEEQIDASSPDGNDVTIGENTAEGSFTPGVNPVNEAFIHSSALVLNIPISDSVIPPQNILLSIKGLAIHHGEPSFKSKIKKMPIQLKSLLMRTYADGQAHGTAKKDPYPRANFGAVHEEIVKEDFVVWANFKNLVRVEFLSGFNGVMAPEWETLTKLPDATNGSKLFCRLVRFEDRDYNIIRPKSLELPIYNEYFLINLE